MTNAVQVFKNEEIKAQIRGLIINDEPWFVAKDVCEGLELADTSRAVARLDDDEKGTTSIRTLGGEQDMLIINEPGLYRLILSSRKQEAKVFQRWVTHEVLPTIRKTGSYSIKNSYSSYTPAANAVRDVQIMANQIQELFAVQRGIAISQAIDIASEMHNAPLQSLKQLLPPAEHETGFLNSTQIGEKLGGIPAKAVNKILADIGLQYKHNKSWRLTELGIAYGEELPFTRNGHSGYQIRWNKAVLDVIREEVTIE